MVTILKYIQICCFGVNICTKSYTGRVKINPKSFRSKRSFVKSFPGEHGVLVAHRGDVVAWTDDGRGDGVLRVDVVVEEKPLVLSVDGKF
jgi:hypothetical protein